MAPVMGDVAPDMLERHPDFWNKAHGRLPTGWTDSMRRLMSDWL